MPSRSTSAIRRVPALRRSDWRGLTRLGVSATVGVVDLVEELHLAIGSRAGLLAPTSEGRAAGITGGVYRIVRGTTRLVGRGLDSVLGASTGRRPDDGSAAPQVGDPSREALLALLNGVSGDHLADSGNPLAITMGFRSDGVRFEPTRNALATRFPDSRAKVLVLVHGLCMNDLQWKRRGHDHGQALARDGGFTPVYLHYNSGRHVSQNGRDFAALLEQLVGHWPVPITELVIVGHSMGGLVTRSACHVGAEANHAWLTRLTTLVFLGTPHHGAPLERGGQLIGRLLGLSPFLAPFTRLGTIRSAGVTDLCFGNLQDADWQGLDRHSQRGDSRCPTPLPDGRTVFIVAATTSAGRSRIADRMIGDGLVPLASALGEHPDPARSLSLPDGHRWIARAANHWDLLSRDDVYRQLRAWLTTDPEGEVVARAADGTAVRAGTDQRIRQISS